MSKSTKIILVIVTLIIIVVTIGITIQLVMQKDKPITLEKLIKSGKSTNIESDQLTVTDLDVNITPEYDEDQFHNELLSDEPFDCNKITMTLKEGTLTRTGATFIVLNQNIVPYAWGAEFCIEKKENGEWGNVPFLDFGFPMTCMYIRKGTPTEMKINWERNYGELKNGEYRVVKGEFYGIVENGEEKLVKNNCFYAYFTIK